MATRIFCLLTLLLCLSGVAFAEEAAGEKADSAPVTVVMETNKGSVEIELNAEKAPISVANFLSYVDKGFYDGTVFHRVIKGFMIQGGGFTEAGAKKQTDPPIKNEADNGLENDPGTIAMARTGVVDSATSQFFINTVNNTMLNHRGPGREFGYAVFGKVTSGMDVVKAIEGVATDSRGRMGDWPVEDVVIKSIKRK
jgi:peptidyl-prolyl cis-trans isomerase A (cyclophilin A)